MKTYKSMPLDFIDGSLWSVETKDEIDLSSCWENEKGNLYRSNCNTPDLADMTILWYIIVKQLQTKGDMYEGILRVTCNEILRECMFKEDLKYDRIIEALRRWQNFTIEFGGKWSDDVVSRSFFSILDYARVAEDGLIEVQVSKYYMQSIISNVNFLRIFSFRFFTLLQDSLACRLYEILCWSLGENGKCNFRLEKLGSSFGIFPENGESYRVYCNRVQSKLLDALNAINSTYQRLQFENCPGNKYRISMSRFSREGDSQYYVSFFSIFLDG